MKEGFLIDLYLGKECDTFIKDFNFPLVGEKAQEIIEECRTLSKEYRPLELEKKGMIPDALWTRMKEIGLFALSIPTEFGGKGLTLYEYLAVVSALASQDMALAIVPLAHLSIGLKALLLYGSPLQKKAYLPRAATGECIFAYALTEPLCGSDAQHITSRAVLDAAQEYYILNGTKTYITNANYAGAMTVFAQLGEGEKEGMSAFIVETGWEGVKISPDMEKMGLKVSSTASVQFKNVKVPKANMIGKPGEGFTIAMEVLNYGRLGLGAASTGIIEKSVTDMLKRSMSRKQFGTSINNFELIQEKISKAIVEGYIIKSVVAFLSTMLEDDPRTNVSVGSSHIKRYGTETAWQVLYDALQIAGGAGYLKSQPYEKRMRDFRVTTVFEGTSEIHTIYPPLVVMRLLSKELDTRTGLDRILYYYRQQNSAINLDIPKIEGVEVEALKLALALTQKLKKLLLKSMKHYKKQITAKELLLRDMTALSTQVLILISTLLRHRDDRLNGRATREDKLVLEEICSRSVKLLNKKYNGDFYSQEIANLLAISRDRINVM